MIATAAAAASAFGDDSASLMVRSTRRQTAPTCRPAARRRAPRGGGGAALLVTAMCPPVVGAARVEDRAEAEAQQETDDRPLHGLQCVQDLLLGHGLPPSSAGGGSGSGSPGRRTRHAGATAVRIADGTIVHSAPGRTLRTTRL